VLRRAAELGHYDMAMVAYNIASHPILDEPIRFATDRGMGIIAMKAAAGVHQRYEELGPIPRKRLERLNRAIPGDMKAQVKGYLWALQNPCITAAISEMYDRQMMEENLTVAGKKFPFNPVA